MRGWYIDMCLMLLCCVIFEFRSGELKLKFIEHWGDLIFVSRWLLLCATSQLQNLFSIFFILLLLFRKYRKYLDGLIEAISPRVGYVFFNNRQTVFTQFIQKKAEIIHITRMHENVSSSDCQDIYCLRPVLSYLLFAFGCIYLFCGFSTECFFIKFDLRLRWLDFPRANHFEYVTLLCVVDCRCELHFDFFQSKLETLPTSKISSPVARLANNSHE